MRRIRYSILYLAFVAATGMGSYEVTAKSPQLLGAPLPGWAASELAERGTRWNPPTGILLVDRLLHEGEEALLYYGLRPSPPRPRGPVRTRLSSRSLNNNR